jgi:hypothetical protein
MDRSGVEMEQIKERWFEQNLIAIARRVYTTAGIRDENAFVRLKLNS